jgi:hypothetical protein
LDIMCLQPFRESNLGTVCDGAQPETQRSRSAAKSTKRGNPSRGDFCAGQKMCGKHRTTVAAYSVSEAVWFLSESAPFLTCSERLIAS